MASRGDAEIREYFRTRPVRWSEHAATAALDDGIGQAEITTALAKDARVIEDYPTDWLGASCLLLAHLEDGRPVHAVIGHAREPWTVITVYLPDPAEWSEDFTERRGQR